MGRSVLVTGGNRGIGLAIAQRLSKAGDSVTITSRSGEEIPGLTVATCDVRDTAAVDAAFGVAEAAHGPVEVVVANAGMTSDQLLALCRKRRSPALSTPTWPGPTESPSVRSGR